MSILVLAEHHDGQLAAASSNGKNVMPRLAALKDVSQISEIVEVDSADTFKRPIYAGNAIATVQSGDSLKVITVRSTGFDAVAEVAEVETESGGSAAIEAVDFVADNSQSQGSADRSIANRITSSPVTGLRWSAIRRK